MNGITRGTLALVALVALAAGQKYPCGVNSAGDCPSDLPCCTAAGYCGNTVEDCSARCVANCRAFEVDSECANAFVADNLVAYTGSTGTDVKEAGWKAVGTADYTLLKKSADAGIMKNFAYTFDGKFTAVGDGFVDMVLQFVSYDKQHYAVRLHENGAVQAFLRVPAAEYKGTTETYQGCAQVALATDKEQPYVGEGVTVFNVEDLGLELFVKNRVYVFEVRMTETATSVQIKLYAGGTLVGSWRTDVEYHGKSKTSDDLLRQTVGLAGTSALAVKHAVVLPLGETCVKGAGSSVSATSSVVTLSESTSESGSGAAAMALVGVAAAALLLV